MRSKDLIERYIYAVVKRLPASRRAEVEAKLRERIAERTRSTTGDNARDDNSRADGVDSIQDNAAEPARVDADRSADAEDLRRVLSEMGDPVAVADEFRGRERALIGSALYETYIFVLKIVLAAVGIGMLIASAIQVAQGDLGGRDVVEQVWSTFASILGNIWNGLLSSFAVVTIVFALVEHYSSNEDLKKMERELHEGHLPWSPDSLPAVPIEKLRIKRSDPIVAIVFSLIFLVIINTMPELIGLYRQGSNGLQITGFVGDGFIRYIPWISVVVVLGIALEILKLAYGRWNWLQVVAGLLQNAFSFVVTMRVIRDPEFIDPRFIIEVDRYFRDAGAAAGSRWPVHLVTALTVIVIVGFIVDTLTIASKGWYLRSGDPGRES